MEIGAPTAGSEGFAMILTHSAASADRDTPSVPTKTRSRRRVPNTPRPRRRVAARPAIAFIRSERGARFREGEDGQ